MPSVKDLPALRRLNARTRAAATRRRRLRKAISAACAAIAVVIALPPGTDHRPATEHPTGSGHLTGRHVLSLPADPALTAALSPSSTVDVWDRRGTRLVARAPVMPLPQSSGAPASTADRAHVLVALRASEMRDVINADAPSTGSERNLVVTIAG